MDAADSLETLPCIKPHGITSHKVVFVFTSCWSRKPHIFLWSWCSVHNPLAYVDGCRMALFSGHIRAACSRFLTVECYRMKLEAADNRRMRSGNLQYVLMNYFDCVGVWRYSEKTNSKTGAVSLGFHRTCDKKKLSGLIPRANYTDRAAAAGRRS